MKTYARTGIQLPDQASDAFLYRQHLAAIGDMIEAQGVLYVTGTAATRPAAGKIGRVRFETDTGVFLWDTGAQWVIVNPSPPADGAAGTPSLRTLGTGAAQAAAGSHAAQHAPDGADPLPATKWVSVSASNVTVPAGASYQALTWASRSSGDAGMWSSSTPARVILPHRGTWAVELRVASGSSGGGDVQIDTTNPAVGPSWVVMSIGTTSHTGFVRVESSSWVQLAASNATGAAATFTDVRLRVFFVSP